MTKEVLKLALEALELLIDTGQTFGALDYGDNAITAIKQALAAPMQDELAYREAVSLATWLFKKHFAHEEHYSSGRVVWEPCDTTAGVISQIDNMVCQLVQPAPVQPEQQEGVWLCRSTKRTETGMHQAWQICSWTEATNHFEKKPNYEYKKFYAPPAPPAPVVQEPVWIQPDHLQKAQKAPFLCRVEPNKRDDFVPLYTTPPAQPERKPLTPEQINTLRQQYGVTSNGRGIKEFTYVVDFVRAIEAAHGIKENT